MGSLRGRLQCRLCQRVTLAVFLGILVIEAIILIPSYRNYERDRLEALALAGESALIAALSTPNAMARLQGEAPGFFGPGAPVLRGVTLYTPDGERLLSAGEPLLTEPAPNASLREQRVDNGERLELSLAPSEALPYRASLRLDASSVGPALYAFVWRIIGLVLLIATFVTAVTMVVLDRLLLRPVLQLRRGFEEAGGNPRTPLAHRLAVTRNDELGDLARAFNQLLQRNARHLAIIDEREAELREQNNLLDRRVEARTRELAESNRSLRLEMDERRRVEESNAILARFPEENSSPVLRVAADGCLLYANPASGGLLRAWHTEVGTPLPADWRALCEAVLKTGSAKSTEVDCEGRQYALQFTPVLQGGYVNVYGLDVTERKRYELQLLEQARHDPVTGLPNLALLTDRIQQTARTRTGERRAGFAVLVLDLMDFQGVNAVADHRGGDEVLRLAAERLNGALGATDTVARIGGDVFAVLAADCPDAEAAARTAECLQEVFKTPFRVEGRELNIGVRLGIALYPGDGESPEALLRNADLALYRAKAENGARYAFFVAGMNVAVEERRQLLGELHQALAGGELELFYQPQIDLADERLLGAEALLRWRSPARGLVSPGEFIPVAESSGFILPMGEWVLQEACRQAAAWRDAGVDSVRVAVNLSALQLEQADIVERVAGTLEAHGLPGEALELEITESLMLRDVERTIRVLSAFAGLGVEISVDDFGTGHSSLSYLQRLPVHKLKIDRAFVEGIADTPRSASICRAVIELGRSLDLTVIAEGVETREQADLLRELGCHQVQGFFYGRPMPAAEFPLPGQGPAAEGGAPGMA